VNNELENLDTILGVLPEVVASKGRVGIISFHSLEDREIKVHFKSLVASGAASFITKKPIVPSISEIGENPRSRSAKLRAITFL
jgi:16S rRNA (cytosine1402-N4)-methyltransferase